MFYFAYGSNMDPHRMRERGIPFRTRVPARLPGWRLEFNKVPSTLPRGAGYANVVPDPRGTVEGALYRIEESALAALDEWEGHPRHYRRKVLPVELRDGTRVTAAVYVAAPKRTRSGLRPTREYLSHMLAGHDVVSPSYWESLAATPTFVASGGARRRGGRVSRKRWAAGRRGRRR